MPALTGTRTLRRHLTSTIGTSTIGTSAIWTDTIGTSTIAVRTIGTRTIAAGTIGISALAATRDGDPVPLPGTPWSVRPAAGPAGRPAAEIYAAGCLVDVMVAPAPGPARPARRLLAGLGRPALHRSLGFPARPTGILGVVHPRLGPVPGPGHRDRGLVLDRPRRGPVPRGEGGAWRRPGPLPGPPGAPLLTAGAPRGQPPAAWRPAQLSARIAQRS